MPEDTGSNKHEFNSHNKNNKLMKSRGLQDELIGYLKSKATESDRLILKAQSNGNVWNNNFILTDSEMFTIH